MAYRDDLDAAHARIEALEAQLAEVGIEVGDSAAWMERTNQIHREVVRLRKNADELKAAFAQVTTSLRAATSDMPTLVEHNRRVIPIADAMSGQPARVRCPMCLVLAGDSVEMRLDNEVQLSLCIGGSMSSGNSMGSVRCPRCNYLGVLF